MDLLDQMATFVRVVEGKSLSAAARSLRLSLPAVSRQLRALEEELGATLVVRSTRRLHVTAQGEEWYRHSVRVLRDIDDAKASMKARGGVRGTLVVSASITFGSVILVPRLKELLAAHRELEVDLRLEDHLVNIVGEGIDVAIRAGSPPPDSTAYVAQPVFTMARVLVAAPELVRKSSPKTLADLGRRPCLVQVTPQGQTIGWALRSKEKDETVEVRARFRTHAPSVLRDLAIHGAGIAYVPDWLVANDIREGRLVRVLQAFRAPPITAWAIYRTPLRGSPRLRAFLAILPKDEARAEE